MRGTVIMWNGERGVVTAATKRFEFDINHWQGGVAPAANMTVEIATDDGKLTGLTPISEADLAKESLAAMTGEGRKYAKAIFANVGQDVAIGYGIFFFLAMFVSLISDSGFIDVRVTLADLLSGHMNYVMRGEGSARGVLLVLIATATMAVPYFWQHKLAPLAFTVPLFFTAKAFWPLYQQHRQQQEAIEAMGELSRTMGELAEQMGADAGGPLSNLGIAAWLLFATVIFLAFRGVMRFRARARTVTSSSAS
jgi:hypothetical protein